MSQILQVNYKFKVSKSEYLKMAGHAVAPIAATPGLQWKIWLMNETEGEAGGLYLFESKEAAQQFLQGPIVAGLKANPNIVEVQVKLFEPINEFTTVTRGPIGIPALS